MPYYSCQIQFASPEYDEAFRIREDLLRKPLDLHFDLKDVKEEYKEYHFAIFDESDKMIGTVILKPLDDPSILKLRQMAIIEQYQRKNAGKQLIANIEKWVKLNGYMKIELHARKSAVGFYEKLGYKTEGEEFMEVNIPHMKMYKTFNS